MMGGIEEKEALEIAVDFLKRRKNTDKIDVSIIEKKGEFWIIRGTCPINLEGHPWAEKFLVILDKKGKIKATNFSLL